MAKKLAAQPAAPARQKPSALVDTRVIYCGDNLEQLQKLPDACVDLIYIDPPFNSNRNYGVLGARPRRSTPLKTATRTPRLTLTTRPEPARS
jgi:16S rRNA G966 N2-methylase RsmD